MGDKLAPAAFGENLTISNLKENEICTDDIFQLGTAVVQVSQLRQPCKTLAARFGKNDFVKLVVDSGFIYFRVLDEGLVGKGSLLTLRGGDPKGISVAFANEIFHHDRKNAESIEKVLSVSALPKLGSARFKN